MQENLTMAMKYATIYCMLPDYHKHEYKRAQLLEKINFHKSNMILQCVVSLMLVTGGLYASQRKSVWVPFIVAPSAGISLSKLAKHNTEYHRYKQQLKSLN